MVITHISRGIARNQIERVLVVWPLMPPPPAAIWNLLALANGAQTHFLQDRLATGLIHKNHRTGARRSL